MTSKMAKNDQNLIFIGEIFSAIDLFLIQKQNPLAIRQPGVWEEFWAMLLKIQLSNWTP